MGERREDTKRKIRVSRRTVQNCSTPSESNACKEQFPPMQHCSDPGTAGPYLAPPVGYALRGSSGRCRSSTAPRVVI